MTKKIEDYLHLYLGCECEVEYWGGEKCRKSITPELMYNFKSNGHGNLQIRHIKPFLRPLNNLTQGEIRNAVNPMVYGLKTLDSPEVLRQAGEITNYLLSKHFDLFNLIESNLAIDSTTSTKGAENNQ